MCASAEGIWVSQSMVIYGLLSSCCFTILFLKDCFNYNKLMLVLIGSDVFWMGKRVSEWVYEDVCRPFLFPHWSICLTFWKKKKCTERAKYWINSFGIKFWPDHLTQTSGLHLVYLIRFVCSSSSEMLKADIRILEMVFPLKTVCWWDRC